MTNPFFCLRILLQVRLTSGRDQVVEEVLAPQALKVMEDGNNCHAYKWTIVNDVTSISVDRKEEYDKVGLIGFNFNKFHDALVEENATPYLDLLTKMWPGDWQVQLGQLNVAIDKANKDGSNRAARIRSVLQFEWWRFIGIIISAAPLGKGGIHLWESQCKKTSRGSNKKVGTPTDYGASDTDIMKYYRFREIKKYFPFAFHDSNNKEDPWHPIGLLVDGFNANRTSWVAASCLKILDEIMSAFVPQTTALGGLPHLSFIFRKPKPLGTEFKVNGCSVTGELKCRVTAQSCCACLVA